MASIFHVNYCIPSQNPSVIEISNDVRGDGWRRVHKLIRYNQLCYNDLKLIATKATADIF
jgi:hypothetical protein